MPEDRFQLKHYLAVVVRRLAAEKDLRQADLGRAMHRKPGVVSQWWLGKVMPDTESLMALARALDTTHAKLMEEAQGLRDAAAGAARELQPSPATTVVRSEAMERRVAEQDLQKVWAKVTLAFNARKVNPERWERVKQALNDLVTDSPQERAAVSSRNRHRRR
jgi:Helix-turn-helix.